MIRVLILLLLVVSAAVAYPWAAAAVAVAGFGVLVLWAGTRRNAPAGGSAGAAVEHVSLERRAVLRRARAELREIERRAGLDPDG